MANRPSRELSVPFRIDGDGAVAFVDNPIKILIQHLVSVIMTRPTERVMLPNYGSPTYNYIFEINEPLVQVQLVGILQTQIAMWEPAVEITSIEPIPTSLETGVMEIRVGFVARPRTEELSTVVRVGGVVEGVNDLQLPAHVENGVPVVVPSPLPPPPPDVVPEAPLTGGYEGGYGGGYGT